MIRLERGAVWTGIGLVVFFVLLAIGLAMSPPEDQLRQARREACDAQFQTARNIDAYRGVASSRPSQEQMDICIGGGQSSRASARRR